MQRSGRVGCLTFVVISAAVLTACSESYSAAQCEANGSGNQHTLQSLNGSLTKDRGNMSALLGRARCLYFLGNYAQAVQDMSEVLRRESKQAEAYLYRGKSLKMLGRIPEALQDYSAAIALRPTADAYYGRGLTYLDEFHGGKGPRGAERFHRGDQARRQTRRRPSVPRPGL